MLYRPNFCCNCGEKIERVDWNILTSRRFCEGCAVENRRHDRLPQTAVAGGILALMFGLGSFLGSSREQPKVQSLSSASAPLRSEPKNSGAAGQAPSSNPTAPAAEQRPASEKGHSPAPNPEKAPQFYACGALTKKGTPCTRKVKIAGARCFQHEGKPAVVPDP